MISIICSTATMRPTFVLKKKKKKVTGGGDKIHFEPGGKSFKHPTHRIWTQN